ncbi:MAG: DUF2939 domain-containing protein [Pseudomonadales bacterium]
MPIIAAVLAVIYVIASLLAAWQIGAAARDRDSEALSESVDFPVLRQNLKDQLNAELLGNAVEETDSSLLGSIGAAIGGVFIDKAVDAWVTPDAIFRLMRGNKAKERSGDRPQPGGEEDGSDTGAARKAENPFRQAAFSYASWDRFNVTIQSRNDEPVTFVLRRRGLGWKLTNIILPLSERSPW